MSVSFACCVLSGSGLCDGPIISSEESYRVCVCDLDTSNRGGLGMILGCSIT